MSRTSLILAFLTLLVGASPLAAQQERRPARERWQATLDGERYVWDIRLVRLDADTLVVRQADTLAHLPVEHLTELRLIRPTEMRAEEGAGGAIAALTGGDDEIYDLNPLEFAERIRVVQRILVDHPQEP